MTVMGTLIQPLPRTRIRIHVPRFTNTETLWHSRAEKQVLSAAKSKMIREAPRRPEATGNHWLPVKNVSMCNPRRDSRVATGAAKRGKKKYCQSRSLVFQATVIICNDYQVTVSILALPNGHRRRQNGEAYLGPISTRCRSRCHYQHAHHEG